MTDSQQQHSPGSDEGKIPTSHAIEIRRLSHDLSNALELILQANYLLGMTASANEDQTKWREMLDQGVMQATEINRRLRDYIRAHS